MASSPNSSGPAYYYSELKGGKKPADGGLMLPGPATMAANQNGTLGRNGNSGAFSNGCSAVNNNPGGLISGSYATEVSTVQQSGRTSAGVMHSLTDESPSSSSVSSSRPSSSREYQQPFGGAQTSAYGTIGGGGATPSGSSPSGFPGGPPMAMQPVPPPAAFANPLLGIEPDTRGSESLPRSFRQQKPTIPQKVSASKQGIYQRSLSLLANGVSPLLRKKHPNSNATSIAPAAKPHHQPPAPSQLPASDALLNSSAASLARRRRKSEPIMFSLDSITNEINRLQQRQEQIMEGLNLEFDPMLMSDDDAYGPVTNGGGARSSASAPGHQRQVASTSDYGSASQQGIYKEPLYMLYDDSYRSSRPEENIYEEVDFMTVSF